MLETKRLRGTQATSDYLGTTPGTLRQSRHTGLLWGAPAPAFRKTPGGKCLYDQDELDNFIERLPTYRNLAEVAIANSK